MATVVADMSVSVDGFIAGPGDRIDEIFAWFSSGDVEVPLPVKTVMPAFRTDEASAAELRNTLDTLGAVVTGRRTFELAGGWSGAHPMGAPAWIVTHNPPDGYEDAPINFVTDGVESAVEQAREAAGDGLVGVAGASIVRQGLNAGVLDAVRLSVAPVLLGDGIRFFDGLENAPIALKPPRVVEGEHVTHLYYEVDARAR
jgi:dihydrofolate reductase